MQHHITGLPVLDDHRRVVGVVSDYDLLSLDAVSGKMQVRSLFAQARATLGGKGTFAGHAVRRQRVHTAAISWACWSIDRQLGRTVV